jgi:macrolide-specific efflux system membrane fusion protein
MSGKVKLRATILIVVLILVIGGFKMFKSSSSEGKPVYTDYIVQKGNLKIKILSTGIIQPENKVEIKPPIAGRIEKVLVSEGTKVKKGQILAWMSSTERAAMLDAASSKGAQELKDWEEMYRATPILAAINGTIIQKNVESGQTFTTADAILVMSDRLTVKAQVDETDIAKIKLKQKARITLDAYPDERIDAVVDQIAYDAKAVNNVTTYIVDVLPESAPAYMRSGMTANVTFEVDSRNDILIVPTEAIKNEDSKTSVLMKNPNDEDKPLERVIEIGLSDGKRTEILSGLNPGDKILIQEIKFKNKKGGAANPFSPMGGGRGGGGGGRGGGK